MRELLNALGPIVATVFLLGIPIVAILTKHQQKMALLLRGDASQAASDQQLAQLRHDVELIRAQMNQQTLLLDTLASQQRDILAALPAKGSLEQRLNA